MIIIISVSINIDKHIKPYCELSFILTNRAAQIKDLY